MVRGKCGGGKEMRLCLVFCFLCGVVCGSKDLHLQFVIL